MPVVRDEAGGSRMFWDGSHVILTRLALLLRSTLEFSSFTFAVKEVVRQDMLYCHCVYRYKSEPTQAVRVKPPQRQVTT